MYRAFNHALLQREYHLWNISDLLLEDYWALQIVAQERRRWEAEIDSYRSQWMKQEAKMDFQNFLLFIPELEEYR